NELQRKKYFSTIGEMASLIAHEVRNPIFAISSIAKILMQKYGGPEDGRFIDSILRETERLNALVEDLLNYGKPLSLEKKPVPVGKLINNSLNGLSSYLEESGCKLELSATGGETTVSVDQERIKQVFYNIIRNAVDAGATQITVSVGRERRFKKIVVKDNGRGIRAADMEKVMKPFFTTKKSGTGLGLPICKKIIEAHGGRFLLKSKEGEGTEITMAFKE
ncbi:MAG: hypothetical protein D6726_11615, partial [Nitrospirae bacterium]